MAVEKLWPNGPLIRKLMWEKRGCRTAEQFESVLKAAVGRRNINLITEGKKKIPKRTLLIIANGLGVELEEIILTDEQKETELKVASAIQKATINLTDSSRKKDTLSTGHAYNEV